MVGSLGLVSDLLPPHFDDNLRREEIFPAAGLRGWGWEIVELIGLQAAGLP